MDAYDGVGAGVSEEFRNATDMPRVGENLSSCSFKKPCSLHFRCGDCLKFYGVADNSTQQRGKLADEDGSGYTDAFLFFEGKTSGASPFAELEKFCLTLLLGKVLFSKASKFFGANYLEAILGRVKVVVVLDCEP